jgi:hypothetical protein
MAHPHQVREFSLPGGLWSETLVLLDLLSAPVPCRELGLVGLCDHMSQFLVIQ